MLAGCCLALIYYGTNGEKDGVILGLGAHSGLAAHSELLRPARSREAKHDVAPRRQFSRAFGERHSRMTASEESQRIQRIALQRLESLQRAGVLHLPKAAVSEDPAAEPVQELTADLPQIAKEPELPPTKATAKKSDKGA